jgi:stage V sporulation protein AB
VPPGLGFALGSALAALAGAAEGLAVGAGLAALVVLLRVGVRLAGATRTLRQAPRYQWALALGAAAAGLEQAYPLRLAGGPVLAGALGLGMGLFVGMLAAALAETAAALPVASRRLGLVPYLPRLVLAVAVGKTVGALAWIVLPGLHARPPA